MAAKKDKAAKLFAYEAFMEQARKEGRVRNAELSIRVLKPDLSLQARVSHVDPGHVQSLHEILKNGQPLAPIVVFEVAPGEFKIADGFHRHEVYRREGLPGIPCFVITGSLQEAIEYAASCNQKLSLGRKREDIKKAAFMLFGNGWINKSDGVISKHIGVAPNSVGRWRVEYCDAVGIEVPEYTIDEKGNTRRRPKHGQLTLTSIRKFTKSGELRHHFQTVIGGKHVYLGINKRRAEERFAKIVDERNRKYSEFKDPKTIEKRTLAHGVQLKRIDPPGDSTLKFVSGYRTQKCAVSIVGHLNSESILRSYAETTFIAKHFGLTRKIVLTPEIGDSFSGLMAIAKKLGVEFMTLDKFLQPDNGIEDSSEEPKAWKIG